jgi:septal ring factor EnvC (AmiA/AmiB activator)
MLKCLAVVGVCLGIGIAPVYATTPTVSSLSAKRAELKSVQSKMLALDNTIDHVQVQQHAIQQQLAVLEKKIGLHAAALRDLQMQVDQKSQDVSNTEKNIQTQIGHINQQKQSLKHQILAAYHVGQHDRLKLLLNEQVPALSGRILVYYEYLNKMRLQKVTQLETDVKQLETLQTQQEQAVDRLNQVVQKKQAEQALLAEAKQSRMLVLRQLHAEWRTDKNRLSRLKSNEHTLKSLLEKLQQDAEQERLETHADLSSAIREPSDAKQAVPEAIKPNAMDSDEAEQETSPKAVVTLEKAHTEVDLIAAGKSFGQLKGHLSWPVAGRIHKKSARESVEHGRDGILIEAPEGQAVRAVAKGRIAYAGWLRGYGMLTIVDHGGGYMTVYAFNQSLYKKTGNKVNAGDVIASVGQSGGQNTMGLYFEIRKQGSPLNPESWCRK